MNHILHLQEVKKEAHELVHQGQQELGELISYLLSSKFQTETWVDVKDVLRRLEPVRSTLLSLDYVTRPNSKLMPR
jgi:hypothetical protein